MTDDGDLDAVLSFLAVQGRGTRQPTGSVLMPGTVTAYTVPTVTVQVGDSPGIPAHNLTGDTFALGQRVMVEFARPHGVYVRSLIA